MRLLSCKQVVSLMFLTLALPVWSQSVASLSPVTPVEHSASVVLQPQVPSELLIGSGDLLQISVEGAPEYMREVRVSREGNITLPMIGTVTVGGLSVSQAQDLIASRLRDGKYFRDPQVSVFAK